MDPPAGRKMYTNQRQFEILVSFVKQYPHLAKTNLKTNAAKDEIIQLWNRIAGDLNIEGPPTRNGSGWKKVFADFKHHTKSKLRRNKAKMDNSDGGNVSITALNPLEEELVVMLNLDDEVNSSEPVHFPYIDSNSYENDSAVHFEAKEEETTNSDEPPSYMADPFPNQSQMNEILHKINANLENLCEYQRKSLQLKEKKLELAKERFQFEKLQAVSNRKLEMEKLAVKRQKLEIELRNYDHLDS